MPILPRLVALYESRGIEVSTGLSPWRFDDLPLASFTWFVRDGRSLTEGFGIAMQEVYFLECLFAAFRPRSIFAIGNSAGWSTLALALLNPGARVLAIDAGMDRNSLEGLAFTNRVAAEEGLDVVALEARSPEGVAGAVAGRLPAPVDFAFIDGYHAVEQVLLDFRAVRPHAAADCVWLFHDVAEFALEPGVAAAAAEGGLAFEVLPGTSSGMAILWDPVRRPEIAAAIAPFRARPAAAALVAREALKRRHRRAWRFGRSLARRAAWLRRRLGLATP